MNVTPEYGWSADRGYQLGWPDASAAKFRATILAEAAAVGEGFCPHCRVRLAAVHARPGWGRCPQCRSGWSASGHGDGTVVDCVWSAAPAN